MYKLGHGFINSNFTCIELHQYDKMKVDEFYGS